MTNKERITQLAQDISVAKTGRFSDVDGDELDNLINLTITSVNQVITEIEKKADWNFVRTNDAVVGSVITPSVISYDLPTGIRKLVINSNRDLTIRFDSSIVSSFKLVNPNQTSSTSEPYDIRDRATVLKRKIIFSRPLKDMEVGGEIIADTISKIPKLSLTDTGLLDILDDEYNDDIRLLFILGVVKNQVLPDVIRGGLTPSFSQKFDRQLQDCITQNNESADSDDQDRENFGCVGGVGF